MIAALAKAGLVFDRPEWIATARRAFDAVRGNMTGEDGRLRHSWREGRARHPASVDDYANLCRAALALHEAGAGERSPAAGARLDFGPRPALPRPRGRGLFLCRGRYAGADHAGQDRGRRGGSGRQRHACRCPDPARDPDRRGESTARGPRRSSALLPARSRAISSRSRRSSTISNSAKRRCRWCLSATTATPGFAALRRAVQQASLPNRILSVIVAGRRFAEGSPGLRQGARRGACGGLCLRGAGLFAAVDRPRGGRRQAQRDPLMFVLCTR